MAQIPTSVLVAVDFGEASARAVAIGGFVADRCRIATLRLMHADTMEAPAYFTSEQIERLDRQQHALQMQADQFLTRFGRQHTTTPFATTIRNGPPVDAILQEAATVDFVVMGTHGRRGPRRWWLGSVAERVLREIRRPLLIVRAETPRREPAPIFERALVRAAAPTDGAATLEFARALAGRVGGEVVDGRGRAFDPALAQSAATVVVVAVPEPKPAGWLSHTGEPLVRSSEIPLLFVPELDMGAAL